MSLVLFCLFLSTAGLEIPYGEPIEADAWAVREDAARGIFDAVILEEIIDVRKGERHTYRKVRILSDDGKAAAGLLEVDLIDFEGRVLYPDGTENEIAADDMVAVLAAEAGRKDRIETSVLVPAGLTGDCIVEYHAVVESWTEELLYDSYEVRGPYHKNKLVFRGPEKTELDFEMMWTVQLITKLVTFNGEPDVVRNADDTVTMTFTDLAPMRYVPMGNPYLNPESPTLGYQSAHTAFNMKLNTLFPGYIVGGELAERMFPPIKRGRQYKRWLDELREKLPDGADPGTIVKTVREDVAGRIKSVVEAEAETSIGRRAGRKTDKYLYNRRLDLALKNGFGNIIQRFDLIRCAVEDLGVALFYFYPSNRFDEPYTPNHNNFDALAPIPFLGARVADGEWRMWTVDTHYPDGFIPARYHGATGLIVNPRPKQWMHKFVSMPRYTADSNQDKSTLAMTLAADGAVFLTVRRERTGVLQAETKALYSYLPEPEREAYLADDWQASAGEWEVTSSRIANADHPVEPTVLHLEAESRLDVSAAKVVLDPFPGLDFPLSSPEYWPPDRVEPILLPHTLQRVEETTIALPEGWQLMGDPSWIKKNGVGAVAYRAKQNGNSLVVRRDIVLNGDAFPAEKEREVRFFLAWMEEAMWQNIAIARTTD